MKNLFFLAMLGCILLTSCDNQDEGITNSVNNKIDYVVQVASPIDLNSIELLEGDSIEVPINMKAVSEDGLQTKSVVEEVIPTNAVLSYRRGSVLAYFGPFWGNMLCDVWTLSVTVDYGYGQWVNGHTGPNTGLRPQGTVKDGKVQLAVQNKKDENSGSWTFSTAVYKPLSSYTGSVQVGCNQYYPFKQSQLEIYYTWIDGNN